MSEHHFKVTFYGVRGSIPSPMPSSEIKEKLVRALGHAQPGDLKSEETRRAFVEKLPVHLKGCVGGNTSCVHVEIDGQHFIFDCGTGLRVLGLELMKREFGKGEGRAHIILSHTHWDHIMGLPFFTPLYVPGNHFSFCGAHENIEERLRGQQHHEYFPIPFEYYGSTIEFIKLSELKDMKIGDILLRWIEMDHPGRSFTYRLDYMDRAVVFSTDSEYKKLTDEDLAPAIAFFRNADLLIFDAQYTLSESLQKVDWGHSTTFVGIDLALKAGVKNMAFYHHEPTYTDFQLVEILESSRDFLEAIAPKIGLKLTQAYEGLVYDLLGDGP